MGLREHRIGPALEPGPTWFDPEILALGFYADASRLQAADSRTLVGMGESDATRWKINAVAPHQVADAHFDARLARKRKHRCDSGTSGQPGFVRRKLPAQQLSAFRPTRQGDRGAPLPSAVGGKGRSETVATTN